MIILWATRMGRVPKHMRITCHKNYVVPGIQP